MKTIVQLTTFSVIAFALHFWGLTPKLNLPNTVPVLYQHLLLGGFSIIIYSVTFFIAKHFYSIVGFVVLGFLTLKMLFLGIFINIYSTEIKAQPVIKYVLLAYYFAYLIFLLVKIIPLINIDTKKKTNR